MRALGVIRKIDDMGRISVPMEVRRAYNWKPYAPIEFLTDEGGVYLRLYRPGCMAEACGETERLVEAAGLRLCRKHAKEIGELVKR